MLVEMIQVEHAELLEAPTHAIVVAAVAHMRGFTPSETGGHALYGHSLADTFGAALF